MDDITVLLIFSLNQQCGLWVQCNKNIRYKKIIKIIDMLGSCTVLDTRTGGTGSGGCDVRDFNAFRD